MKKKEHSLERSALAVYGKMPEKDKAVIDEAAEDVRRSLTARGFGVQSGIGLVAAIGVFLNKYVPDWDGRL